MEKELPKRINATFVVSFDTSGADFETLELSTLDEMLNYIQDCIAEDYRINPDVFIYTDENGNELGEL